MECPNAHLCYLPISAHALPLNPLQNRQIPMTNFQFDVTFVDKKKRRYPSSTYSCRPKEEMKASPHIKFTFNYLPIFLPSPSHPLSPLTHSRKKMFVAKRERTCIISSSSLQFVEKLGIPLSSLRIVISSDVVVGANRHVKCLFHLRFEHLELRVIPRGVSCELPLSFVLTQLLGQFGPRGIAIAEYFVYEPDHSIKKRSKDHLKEKGEGYNRESKHGSQLARMILLWIHSAQPHIQAQTHSLSLRVYILCVCVRVCVLCCVLCSKCRQNVSMGSQRPVKAPDGFFHVRVHMKNSWLRELALRHACIACPVEISMITGI